VVIEGRGPVGPVGPFGRDRQILFDYYPDIWMILPTPECIRSVRIRDLMPLGKYDNPIWPHCDAAVSSDRGNT
jgi:hypothetical protein